MEFYKFVTLYRRELIPALLLATILFQVWVYLQRRYNLYNGWFVTGYMLFNMYSSAILFYYLIGEL